MSITLYTPATGYPDLEVKIAYGLARVGIEVSGMEKVSINNEGGFYSIKIEDDGIGKFSEAFNLICKKVLSSKYIPFLTPGIKGRSAESIPITFEESYSLDIYDGLTFSRANKKSENACGHEGNRIGNIIGFTMSTSYHHTRDGIDVSFQLGIPRRPTNPKNICKTCALLSLLGAWYATFIFNLLDREVIVIPVPKANLYGKNLQEIFSLQHQIRKWDLGLKLPQILVPLVFLSKLPSSAEILKSFDLIVGVLNDQKGRQGYHVDGLFLIPIEKYLNYFRESPFNIAVVDKLIKKQSYASLIELNKTLRLYDKESVLNFSRLYMKETSDNNYINLLYPETAKYLLKEVAMIEQSIIENSSLSSLARTLRYFIRQKKYGYADDIRNSRSGSKDFEETIAKMLREGRLRLEQKEKIHLPTEEEMKEVFRLANENFEATKTALVLLAFSFPSKPDELENNVEPN
ncbi:MAG: type I-A CRISPR-associated protein Csa5 [Candidatus Aminicenantes bacterium]|nr:type I-A CRISPR-associated protein Csa5 [Candidatus Aminicenantes bacterium]